MLQGAAQITSTYGPAAGGTSGFKFLIKLISTLDYLVMTNGKRTMTSDKFLDLFRVNPLELYDNKIDFAESQINCIPTENFERE